MINVYNIQIPSQVYSLKLGIPSDYKSQLISKVYEIGDQMDHKTNVKADMSKWKVFESTDLFDPLLKNIRKSLTHTHYENMISDISNKVILDQAWTSIYRKGDHTTPHSHFPCPISFIYYIQADPKSAPLIFEGSNFKVHPEDDTLILFDGNINHSVETHKSSQDRLIVAGNFLLLNADYHINKDKIKDIKLV